MIAQLEEVRTLETIEQEIQWHSEQANTDLLNGLTHKIRIGSLFNEAKEQIPHGQWLPWLERIGWSQSSVQRHMVTAANYPNLGNLPADATWDTIMATIQGKPENIHFSSNSAEWYTPPEIIERVQQVFPIDLDPCSNEGRNVPAARHFTIDNDGLTRLWSGRVYMNPPYGKVIGDWVGKLRDEYEAGNVLEAIALVPARTDTEWFSKMRDCAICFINGRLRFSGMENSAPFPSAVVYFGDRLQAFNDVFGDMGDVWVRLGRDRGAV